MPENKLLGYAAVNVGNNRIRISSLDVKVYIFSVKYINKSSNKMI